MGVWNCEGGGLLSEHGMPNFLIPATFILMGTAFMIWVGIAVILGVIAAVKRYSLFDQGVTLFSYIFYSLPTFWLGLVLI